MPDHSSDAARAATRAEARAGRVSSEPAGGSHRPRTDWRLGGRTVLHWREWLLAAALLSLGIAIVAGTAVEWLWQSPWAAASATALLWVGMLVPIVWALSRSRPAGLLRFRALDLLYGVALGAMLRLVQGSIAPALGGGAAFPSYPLVDGRLSQWWWLTDVVAVVMIAPVIEEFFFRGVILVSLYTVLRRPFGKVAAGTVAVVASAALFVLLHAVAGGMSVDEVVAIAFVGLVCASLVMLTGRIWAAVLVHAVFNATYVALALTGTFLV